jgi:flagellar assembly protein FliH
MSLRNYVPAEQGRTLPRAVFPPFDGRPINYYRDVFAEEIRHGEVRLDEREFNARLEELLAAERRQHLRQHEEELRERYEAGVARGRSEGSAELAQATELLRSYAELLQAEKRELAARAEQSALELAFVLARKIVGDELQARPEAVADVARMALQQILSCDEIRLRVNPDDLAYVRAVQSDLESKLGEGARLEMRADPSVERGGCVIDTEQGNLDARISSQLETLRAGLQEKS